MHRPRRYIIGRMVKQVLARWSRRQRQLAAAFAVFWIVGVVLNWARTSTTLGDATRGAVTFAATGVMLAPLAFFAWEFRRGRHSLRELGFALDSRRSVIVTVGTAVFLVVFLVRFPLSIAAFTPAVFVPMAAVLVEEILFRPVLIRLIRKLLAPSPRSLEWAILLSAVLWALAHVPSKPPSLVVGIFVTGLIVGALYGYSGSNVFGFVFHASANAGPAGGLMMFVLCLAAAALRRPPRRPPDD